MKTLVLLCCMRDAKLAHLLVARIGQLQGWRQFSDVLLSFEAEVPVPIQEGIMSLVPDGVRTSRVRPRSADGWASRRAETMLSVYHDACDIGSDIVRMDPDVFIRDAGFFDALASAGSGVSGKLMKLHLPARIQGKPLQFVQGGVSIWGADGRNYLANLAEADIVDYKRRFRELVECEMADRGKEYEYFLTRTEDVILGGVLAMQAGLQQTGIPRLQVSPYDVLKDHRSEKWTYGDHVAGFEASGALAFHFEGSHAGRRETMTNMLLRHYMETGSTAEA